MRPGSTDDRLEHPFERAVEESDIRPEVAAQRVPGAAAGVRRQDGNSGLVRQQPRAVAGCRQRSRRRHGAAPEVGSDTPAGLAGSWRIASRA